MNTESTYAYLIVLVDVQSSAAMEQTWLEVEQGLLHTDCVLASMGPQQVGLHAEVRKILKWAWEQG